MSREQAAESILRSLARVADQKRNTPAKSDYFATSLPNLLLFDDDLGERSRIESLLLSALADHGLGNTDKAIGGLREVIAADPDHLFATSVLEWMEHESKLAGIEPEVRPAS